MSWTLLLANEQSKFQPLLLANQQFADVANPVVRASVILVTRSLECLNKLTLFALFTYFLHSLQLCLCRYAAPTWTSGASLSSLAGTTVKFRIALVDAKLFAVRVGCT
jgi:hypothetical protein